MGCGASRAKGGNAGKGGFADGIVPDGDAKQPLVNGHSNGVANGAGPPKKGTRKRKAGSGKAGAGASEDNKVTPGRDGDGDGGGRPSRKKSKGAKGKKGKKGKRQAPPEVTEETEETEADDTTRMLEPVIEENEVGNGKNAQTYCVSLFQNRGTGKGLNFAVRDCHGTVHAVSFSEHKLSAFKAASAVKHSWQVFFRSLSTAGGKMKIQPTESSLHVEVPITHTKDPKQQTATFTLHRQSDPVEATEKYFFEPFFDIYLAQFKNGTLKKADVLDQYCQVKESHDTTRKEIVRQSELTIEYLAKSKKKQEDVGTLKETSGEPVNYLDHLYSVGGARIFTGHVSYAPPYEPIEVEEDDEVAELIPVRYCENPDADAPLTLPPLPQELSKQATNVLTCLDRIDKWDYNVFELHKVTGGASLFHTAFALFHKYDLIQAFNIPVDVLTNFLRAVQAGYRPNSYHNSLHAADVLHITHFMLSTGGMMKLVGLSPLDTFAALMAAAIHDYDHPGFNNNFHTRTGAYLATLYNDRSVLENHHCACVFEMMYDAKYDILVTLSEEQRKDVRETVVELVLSTDMGNHARLISSFKRRLGETEDWVSKREDAKLAMVMAIKTADVSNCARPENIYLQWAHSIAEEFYSQGDKEQLANLPVSPFMDRSKRETDFSKGQVSFINFIVMPLFQTMAELLPGLSFSIGHCESNRERWLETNDKGQKTTTTTAPAPPPNPKPSPPRAANSDTKEPPPKE